MKYNKMMINKTVKGNTTVTEYKLEIEKEEKKQTKEKSGIFKILEDQPKKKKEKLDK